MRQTKEQAERIVGEVEEEIAERLGSEGQSYLDAIRDTNLSVHGRLVSILIPANDESVMEEILSRLPALVDEEFVRAAQSYALHAKKNAPAAYQAHVKLLRVLHRRGA